MTTSGTYAYIKTPVTWRLRLIHLPMMLKCIAYAMLVIVLARPQSKMPWDNDEVNGIDIMLAMDISTSMLANDLYPNRMEAAKGVAEEFISDRSNDNIGLTIFAGEAFTQCPMTTDHASLLNLIHSASPDIVVKGLIKDGTAIGMGLTTAVARLKNSKTKSKIVILLTDGSNNSGDISPLTAAQMAKSLGIRVYTIGVGSDKQDTRSGGVLKHFGLNFVPEFDTTTLEEIATTTDGCFYRATNTDELSEIYKEIDKLEKTKFSVQQRGRKYDYYQPFAVVGLLSLLLSILLKITVYRTIP